METNGLDRKSLLQLRKKLRSKAPFIQTDGLRPSRCILGQPAYSVESRGYENVMLYMEKGFGKHEKVCSDVVKEIVDLQYENGIKYFLCMFSFGWEDVPLKHTGSGIFLYLRGNWKPISKKVCELAGTAWPDEAPVLRALFPGAAPYSRVTRVRPDDLLIFFCRDRSVSIDNSLSSSYNRLRHRALWVFYDGDVCEWEFGFRPRVVENSEEIKQQEVSCQGSTVE